MLNTETQCPVCGKRFAVGLLQVHVNECLDAQSVEQVFEAEDSEFDNWVVVQDANPADEKPARLSKRSRMKNKLKAKKEKLLKSGELAHDDLSSFVHVQADNYTFRWKGDDFVDRESFTANFAEQRKDFEKRVKIWKDVKLSQSRAEVIAKQRYLLRKGVCYQWRNPVWKAMGAVFNAMGKEPNLFSDLYHSVFGDTIPKTLITVPTFSGQLEYTKHILNAGGISCANRILCGIASSFIELDYCPVLCNLVPIVLCFLNEEETFHLVSWMIRVSKKDQFFFGCSCKQSITLNLTFCELVRKKLPGLYEHMSKLGVSVDDFSSDWFAHLFVGVLPYDCVFRVFDAYLSEGRIVLFRVGLAILDGYSAFLMGCKTKKSLDLLLQGIGSCYVNHNSLMKRAFKYFITSRRLNSLEEGSEAVSTKLEIKEPDFQLYYRPKFQPSAIITTEQFEIIYSWLPDRIRIKDPIRLFLSTEDGYSLRTMVAQSYSHDPTMIVMRTAAGEIFGAFVTGEWKQDSHWFGSEEMFLFVVSPTADVFRARPEFNRQYIMVNESEIQIGQGNYGVGLFLDEELWKGYSRVSATYDNISLAGKNEDFEVKSVELWGFM